MIMDVIHKAMQMIQYLFYKIVLAFKFAGQLIYTLNFKSSHTARSCHKPNSRGGKF